MEPSALWNLVRWCKLKLLQKVTYSLHVMYFIYYFIYLPCSASLFWQCKSFLCFHSSCYLYIAAIIAWSYFARIVYRSEKKWPVCANFVHSTLTTKVTNVNFSRHSSRHSTTTKTFSVRACVEWVWVHYNLLYVHFMCCTMTFCLVKDVNILYTCLTVRLARQIGHGLLQDPWCTRVRGRGRMKG